MTVPMANNEGKETHTYIVFHRALRLTYSWQEYEAVCTFISRISDNFDDKMYVYFQFRVIVLIL